jgi:hypothetical protein
MEIKRLVQECVYRIEPKPEGGFIARASDPDVPPLEAATREELQQKIQAKLVAALGVAFPGIQLPQQGTQVSVTMHVDRRPGGGFSVQSDNPGTRGFNPHRKSSITTRKNCLVSSTSIFPIFRSRSHRK